MTKSNADDVMMCKAALMSKAILQVAWHRLTTIKIKLNSMPNDHQSVHAWCRRRV